MVVIAVVNETRIEIKVVADRRKEYAHQDHKLILTGKDEQPRPSFLVFIS